jgi:hypothetical protein
MPHQLQLLQSNIMNSSNGDRVFSGSIAQLYAQYRVPLIFEHYARDPTNRVASRRPASVLEVAAGPGVVTRHMAARLPDSTNPPRFLSRLPHGYFDQGTIVTALSQGGFTGTPVFETVTAQSPAESPRFVATAFCQGTPLCNEIEARDASTLAEATDIVTAAIGQRFGMGQVTGKIQAIGFAATRSA